MEQEKQVFNLPEGVKEVVIRQGDAPKVLDPKAPLPYEAKGQLPSVAEYLQKRIGAKQFEQRNCTIYVNREKVEIVLVFNERDGYNRGTVMGSPSHCIRISQASASTGMRRGNRQSWDCC